VHKLTLSVDAAVVGRAKRYASRRGTSISRLVEDYLRLVSGAEEAASPEKAPVLSRLRGCLRGVSAARDEHVRHLERKYR
jgi:hypothetical protein